MITRDAVNFVMRYTVSDTETLRKVHLFMFPEEHAGPERPCAFSTQDLPYAEALARYEEFLAAARAQAEAGSATAAEAARRLEELGFRLVKIEEARR